MSKNDWWLDSLSLEKRGEEERVETEGHADRNTDMVINTQSWVEDKKTVILLFLLPSEGIYLSHKHWFHHHTQITPTTAWFPAALNGILFAVCSSLFIESVRGFWKWCEHSKTLKWLTCTLAHLCCFVFGYISLKDSCGEWQCRTSHW